MIEYIENNWHETVRIYWIHKKLINDCQHSKKNFNLNFKYELTGL
jgi:hypothetical protein